MNLERSATEEKAIALKRAKEDFERVVKDFKRNFSESSSVGISTPIKKKQQKPSTLIQVETIPDNTKTTKISSFRLLVLIGICVVVPFAVVFWKVLNK